MRTAWAKAAQAWEAASQPYPLAVALLRSAEAALSAGDRDGGAARLRRAALLAQRCRRSSESPHLRSLNLPS